MSENARIFSAPSAVFPKNGQAVGLDLLFSKSVV
jgi:hypothetical protein